jgi:hypothetical protein
MAEAQMESTYVDILRLKRREILTEIEGLRQQMADLTNRVGIKENQLKNIDDLLVLEGPTPNSDGETSDDGRAVARSQRFVERAFEVLFSSGQPMHYREIARRLSEQGVYVPGQDPAANLLAQMSRDARFSRATGRGTYGLSEWPSLKVARRNQPSVTSTPRKRATRTPRRG